MTLSEGTRLGPYEVVAFIGSGGIGDVYRARDSRLGRDVAIKLLPSDVGHDVDRRHRFEREARAIAALNHQHICTIHDIGVHDGHSLLVMELLEGETLAAMVDRGPLRTEVLIDLASHVADALDAAHASGIIHRDLNRQTCS